MALYCHYYSFTKVHTAIKNKKNQDEGATDDKGQDKGYKEANKQDNNANVSHSFIEKGERIRFNAS